jgi:hypothetical protein
MELCKEDKSVRKTKHDGNLTMRAFAGTHVVLLGWSMTKLKSRRVLGFAVHRTDHTEGEAFWLDGIKVFEETDPVAQARLPYARTRSKASPGRTSRRSLVTNTPTAWSP